MAAARAVLDTNVVVSALLFAQGRLSWLRQAWQSGAVVPVVCRETASELIRVLAYPKFKLSAQERQELLSEFLPHAETAEVDPAGLAGLPICRDADDQIFVLLAASAQVSALVTGDSALLALRSALAIPILSAEEFRAQFT